MRLRRLLFGMLVFVGATIIAATGFATHAQYYVLDGFGGVHAGNGAGVISPATPYFGFDVAADIAYVPGAGTAGGDGVIVLDDFGGIHTGGAVAGSFVPNTPYFGFDIARAIVYRNIPPRVASAGTSSSNQSVTSASFVSVVSTTINAPDDGFVVAMCSLSMGNNGAAGTKARLAIGVDSLAAAGGIEGEMGFAVTTGGNFSWESPSRIQTISVAAGAHTFHCLVRRQSGTDPILYFSPAISAVFIDQTFNGVSAPETIYSGPNGSGGQ